MTNCPITLDGRAFSPDGQAPAPPAGGAFRCAMCDRVHPLPTSGVSVGYAEHDGDKICYECCALIDRLDMADVCAAVDRGGRPAPVCLYLTFPDATGKPMFIGNWPGSLKFWVRGRKRSWHCVPGRGRTCERWDVWFDDPATGRTWHGVNIGDSQILRCLPHKRRADAR